MVIDSPSSAPARRGRGLLVTGLVLAVAALIVGVVAAVLVTTAVGGPLKEAMSNPSRPTPVDTRLDLDEGRYTVFELVAQSPEDPILNGDRGTTVTADQVQVIGPDGRRVATSSLGSLNETLTRGQRRYTGAVRFVAPTDGSYHVAVAGTGTQVVIAPALGSGFGHVLPWLGAGLVSVLVFVVGVILAIVGAVRGRRRPQPYPQYAGSSQPYSGSGAAPGAPPAETGAPPSGTGAPPSGTGDPAPGPAPAPAPESGPPAGWYPAPDTAGRHRYWDGRAWTEHLR